MTTLSDEQICLGHDEDLADQHGAMMPPIIQTSLFAQATLEQLLENLDDERNHSLYSRGRNPTVAALERKLAALERGEACLCFASGMAAISAVVLGLLSSGNHLLLVNRIYGPTLQLVQRLRDFGIEYDTIDSTELKTVAASIRSNTRLIYLESPGTMTFQQLDIRRLTGLTQAKGITTVIDNTWATPLFQKPLTMGVDISIHSCSKYIGGHSDVVAGAVVSRKALIQQIFQRTFMLHGGVVAPFTAWLLIRGLRTLPLRMRQHQDDALEVAHFLTQHPAVSHVYHPALEVLNSTLKETQLTGYSGLFSFCLAEPSFEHVCRVVNRLRCFRVGVSWGGVESLVMAPKPGQANLPAGLIRLSIGHEGSKQLIEDLDQALSP